jgi:hypothetical protein
MDISEEDVTIVVGDELSDDDTTISIGHQPDSDGTLWIGTSNVEGDCSWFISKEDWAKVAAAVEASFLRGPRKDDEDPDPTDDNPIKEDE